MNSPKLKVVHYLNQFFGQEGQEEKADMKFVVKPGPVGPGLVLQKILGEKGQVIATIVCGDNYFAEHMDEAAAEAIKLIAPYEPDLFFAGPAFEAGRYGMACGAICKAVGEKLDIPAVTGMFEENPGVDLFRRHVYICKTGRSTLKIAQTLGKMVTLALKLLSPEGGTTIVAGEMIGRPTEDGYFSRGIMKNEYTPQTAAARGVEMLLAKMQGRTFETEVELPKFQSITPPPAMRQELGACEIALISDGGLVPKGNPHGIRGRGNLVWAAYDLESFLPGNYSPANYEIAHTGYYPARVLENPNRLIPVDILRDLEREKVIEKLHPLFYSTSGNGVMQKRCEEMGEEILQEMKKRGVDGAILTSTWGTSTRCGATMAAAIERQGFPVVNITAVPTVSSMIGVTRVLRGESVANLLGNIEISPEQEKMLRRRYVLRALEILRMELKEKQVFTLEGTE